MTSMLIEATDRIGPAERRCACNDPACGAAFARMRQAAPVQRRQLRNRLVEQHLPLARSAAARYRLDARYADIRQAAILSLLEAAERFEPRRGVPFSAYAVATVTGALKHYIRDNRWLLQAPRRVSELLLEVYPAKDRLRSRLGREPTDAETAAAIGCCTEEVRAAERLAYEQQALSLDGPAPAAGEGGELADILAADEDIAETVANQSSLRVELGRLPQDERQAVTLRFYGNLTQREIGDRLGHSQVQVSRLLSRALRRLRSALLTDAGDRAGCCGGRAWTGSCR